MLESVDLRPRLRKALCASGGAAGAAGGAEVRALAAAERSVSGCKLLCQVLAATTDAKAIDAMHLDAPGASPPPPPRILCSLARWMGEALEEGHNELLQFCLVALLRANSTAEQRWAAGLGSAVRQLHEHACNSVRDFARRLTAQFRTDDMRHDDVAAALLKRCVLVQLEAARAAEEEAARAAEQQAAGAIAQLEEAACRDAQEAAPAAEQQAVGAIAQLEEATCRDAQEAAPATEQQAAGALAQLEEAACRDAQEAALAVEQQAAGALAQLEEAACRDAQEAAPAAEQQAAGALAQLEGAARADEQEAAPAAEQQAADAANGGALADVEMQDADAGAANLGAVADSVALAPEAAASAPVDGVGRAGDVGQAGVPSHGGALSALVSVAAAAVAKPKLPKPLKPPKPFTQTAWRVVARRYGREFAGHELAHRSGVLKTKTRAVAYAKRIRQNYPAFKAWREKFPKDDEPLPWDSASLGDEGNEEEVTIMLEEVPADEFRLVLAMATVMPDATQKAWRVVARRHGRSIAGRTLDHRSVVFLSEEPAVAYAKHIRQNYPTFEPWLDEFPNDDEPLPWDSARLGNSDNDADVGITLEEVPPEELRLAEIPQKQKKPKPPKPPKPPKEPKPKKVKPWWQAHKFVKVRGGVGKVRATALESIGINSLAKVAQQRAPDDVLRRIMRANDNKACTWSYEALYAAASEARAMMAAAQKTAEETVQNAAGPT